MRSFKMLAAALVAAVVTIGTAHEVHDSRLLVIDSDIGLDDSVALAMALQHPNLDIAGLVMTEGASGREKGTQLICRMLDLFNRSDITLYAPADVPVPNNPPWFRDNAQRSVAVGVPESVDACHKVFSPDAYRSKRGKTTVLLLGPLTNFAHALREDPSLKDDIAEVIIVGPDSADDNWNAKFDPDAFAYVTGMSDLPLKFVVPGKGSAKPFAWRGQEITLGQGTAIGETFVQRLFEDNEVRGHYIGRFVNFYDEIGIIYLTEPGHFEQRGDDPVFIANAPEKIARTFIDLITGGRQQKARVVFKPGNLPEELFQEDVRRRMERIIEKNGPDEWFAQILMNEFHEHLGAFSIVGVKMGLRAAELLNAPPHGMKVRTHVPLDPPIGCINDGIIVATGCTPGRGLFGYVARDTKAVAATFEYNGRSITLTLDPKRQQRIRAEIKSLLAKHTLEDHEYWHGVRHFGLEIWENWHRKEIFTVE